jgi:hypothetical protein
MIEIRRRMTIGVISVAAPIAIFVGVASWRAAPSRTISSPGDCPDDLLAWGR